MIAAITLKMLDPFGTGKLVLFQVTYDKVCLLFYLVSRVVKTIIGLACLGTLPLLLDQYLWCKVLSNLTLRVDF